MSAIASSDTKPSATCTLAKWGNSQGIRIPKEACDALGLLVGAQASLVIDQAKSTITLSFQKPQRKYGRCRQVSLEELCADANWDGEKVGEEWGGFDVGAEVVE